MPKRPIVAELKQSVPNAVLIQRYPNFCLSKSVTKELEGRSQGPVRMRSSPGNNVVFWGTLTNLCLASVSCKSSASIDGGADWMTQ